MICHGPPWSPFSEITGHLSLRGSFPSSCFSLSLFPLLDFSATILKSVLYQSGLNLTSVGITGSHTAWLSMPLVRILQNLGLLWYSFFFGPTWHTVLFSYCSFGLIPLTSYKSVDKPVPAPPVALGSSGHSAASTDWESIDHCCESEACFFLHLSDDRFSHKPFSFTHENIFLLKTVFSILFCPTDRFTWINI